MNIYEEYLMTKEASKVKKGAKIGAGLALAAGAGSLIAGGRSAKKQLNTPELKERYNTLAALEAYADSEIYRQNKIRNYHEKNRKIADEKGGLELYVYDSLAKKDMDKNEKDLLRAQEDYDKAATAYYDFRNEHLDKQKISSARKKGAMVGAGLGALAMGGRYLVKKKD